MAQQHSKAEQGSGSPTLYISIDGASKGNPGPAGIGVVIRDARGRILREISERIGTATNNEAEYTALIRALAAAIELRPPASTRVIVRTDSELLQRQLTGVYRIKAPRLKILSLEAMSLRRRFKEALFVHVPREQNRRADELASAAAEQE